MRGTGALLLLLAILPACVPDAYRREAELLPRRGTSGFFDDASRVVSSVSAVDQPASTAVAPSPIKPIPGAKMVVVVDAGHGGKDPGAVAGGVREKDIVLRVARRLAALLRRAGATVFLTRDGDRFVSLRDRVARARKARADIFVSVHVNSAGSKSAHGAEIIYKSLRHKGLANRHLIWKSRSLAQEMEKGVGKAAGASRGLKLNKRHLYVLKYAPCPAVLVECGFVSNPAERARMLQPAAQERLAYEMYRGVREYRLRRMGR